MSQINAQDKKNAKNLNCSHVSMVRHTSESIWRKRTQDTDTAMHSKENTFKKISARGL